MQDFVHLHVHTEYSLLDGANRIKDLVGYCGELGMKSIAITDHGVMYGAIDFYKEAVKNGIKPILGCEVYTARRTRFDKQSNLDSDQGHLVLLAENMTGYKNLMKIVSSGFTEGFYYKPRIDMELLERWHEGIIALSACLAGDIPAAILSDDYEKAKNLALKYDSIFGRDNFFLELQINGIKEQLLVNQNLIKISSETGIPIIATNDAHYLKREDARAHEILLCIQTARSVNDEDRMKFPTDEFYIKSPEEMGLLFKNLPEAVNNTVKVAERCNVELEFNKSHFPEYKVPEGTEPFKYLEALCMEGLKERYGSVCETSAGGAGISDCVGGAGLSDHAAGAQLPFHSIGDLVYTQACARLNYELSVIKQMGYIDYFLVVWDFIKFAKDMGIMVGPGRGSAAGSIAAYCLGITNIDPLKYNLLFERFLNPERISMPDIDIDFCYERRQEVIDYVVRKYGADRVAQIITFGTMAARAAIRDVGRALDIPYNEVDVVAKMVPFQIGMNIDKALEQNPELKKLYSEDERIKELINTARLLEGMPRHASTHAAGVVISKDPITEYLPLQKNEDNVTTQFSMGLLEELGLLKMDFLGLRTLTVIRDALILIQRNHGVKVDINSLSMDDMNVYKLIGEGKTSGIFQLESSGMTLFMKELQPASLEDIIAGISLYRPGPMDQIPRYIRNKNNPAGIKYAHPMLETILDVTYGCMVYQEQVMQIVRELAGYSMGRSDLLRRAMSKKKMSVMQQERQNFIYGITDKEGKVIVNGAIRNGVDENTANTIFDEMTDFASYAFNKSHAAAYAVIAYQTGWLKCYYTVEFTAALLNSFLGSSDKVSEYIHECKKMHIEVLPPDVNESGVRFSVVGGKIRFGLVAVKNAGEQAIRSIIEERESGGLYKSFGDFCQRISGRDINKRCIESLIKSGTFDSLGIYRSRLMAVYEKMMDGIQQNKKRNIEGQFSLFDAIEESGQDDMLSEEYPDISEFPAKVLLSMEKEMLGLYLSGHPLAEYEDAINEHVTLFSTDINSYAEADNGSGFENSHTLYDGLRVKVGGIITQKKTKTTKSNSLMAFITLEDMLGSMEIIVFPAVLEKYSNLIQDESIVLISGRISIKEEEQPKIICEDVKVLKNEDRPKVMYEDIKAFKSQQGTVNGKEQGRGQGEVQGRVNGEEQNGRQNGVQDKRQGEKQRGHKRLWLKIGNIGQKENLHSILSMLKFFSGSTPVFIYDETEKQIKDNESRNVTALGREYWVNLNNSLVDELENQLGKESVKVVG